MKEFSKEMWEKYIKNHLDRFDITELNPDRYHAYNLIIGCMNTSLYNSFGSGESKEDAIRRAIVSISAVLYEFNRTPYNI